MIVSRDNERLKQIRKLRDRSWRDKLGLFFVEGEDSVAAATGAPVDVLRVGEDVEPKLLAGAQQVDRLGRGRLDRVLTLDEEQSELLAPAAVVQLPNELEALVVPGDDHSSTVLTDIFL